MTDSGTDPETDGGVPVALEEDELYAVVQTAVRDAMLDVLGTAALLGFALLFVAAGALLVFATADGAVFGVACIVLGFAVAAAAVGLVPPFRD